MEERILFMSADTRQGRYMSENEFRRQLGKYIRTNLGRKYNQLLQPGVLWSINQAVHLLAGEDPEDSYWDPRSGYHKSLYFKKIYDAIEKDFEQKKILLMSKPAIDGRTIWVAENIVFIRWAIARGFGARLPEPFLEFSEKSPAEIKTSQTTLFDLDPPVSLDNIMKLYNTGQKTIENSKKAANRGVEIRAEEDQPKLEELLLKALRKAEVQPGRYSAKCLAQLVFGELDFIPHIAPDTFRKKISQDLRLRPLLAPHNRRT